MESSPLRYGLDWQSLELNIAMSIVRQYLQLPLPPTESPGPFNLADFNKLKNFLLQAEFNDVKSEKIRVTFEFDSAEDYVSFTQDIAARVNMMLANVTAEKKSEIWNIVTDKVKSHYTRDNGRVILDNETICVAANRQRIPSLIAFLLYISQPQLD